MTLVDSIAKKTRFLSETAQVLNFGSANPPRVTVVTGRAEEQARLGTRREKFDYATARAVGKLDLVAELSIPLLKLGGKLLAAKSRKQSVEETAAAQDFIKKLGGSTVEVVSPNMVATGKDSVVLIIEKVQPTPERYPRPMSQIKRQMN